MAGKNRYIGIDLGGRGKKTTGLCILSEKEAVKCELVKGKDVLSEIKLHLKQTQAIAIDAPLTIGQGRGKFRLYEKFLSTRIFRQEKVTPLPPALMQKFCDFARELRGKLEKEGFVLDINMIEVFPALVQKICRKNILAGYKPLPKSDNQKSALLCAVLAKLHAQGSSRWLGYRDGFLFLPETSFWKKRWRQKFEQAWRERDRLKYRRLITNIFK